MAHSAVTSSQTGPPPTVTLCIPVYKGGSPWEECWASVLPQAGLFDRILVSVNHTDLQPHDLAVVRSASSPNLHVIAQRETRPVVEHMLAYLDALETDYVFFLAHDDWLLPEGAAEAVDLLRRNRGRSISILGSQRWTETDTAYGGVSCELAAAPDGMSPADVVLADIDNFLAMNMSGLVAPVRSLLRWKPVIRAFTRGIRLDNFLVTHPGVDRVFQTRRPSVKIRLHAEQAGRFTDVRPRAVDNVTYYFAEALYGADRLVVVRAVEQLMLLPFRYREPYALWHLAKLVWMSALWPRPRRFGAMARALPAATCAFFRNRLYRRPLRRQPDELW